MESFKTIDLFTAYDRMLILASRYDYLAVYTADKTYTLLFSNQASEFNELVAPGQIVARIIFGVLHLAELDKSTTDELKFRARRFNENIAHN